MYTTIKSLYDRSLEKTLEQLFINSKSTFNSAFKRHAGIAPKEYIK
jgi:methylphosphotriester-DNA--protein-cysteine methyltransferase